MTQFEFVDVLVCGGGPVGLLIALGLSQQGIETMIIEKRELAVQEQFGRACTIYPRTMELLEQLDVADEMIQVAYTGRSWAAFRDGKKVNRKGFQAMFPLIDQSFHNYIVNIRQNSSQRIFAKRYKNDFGRTVQYGWELVSQAIDLGLNDGYNVTATLSHELHGQKTVRCKYLVGADGGRSTVRELAKVEMQGNETTYKWIRVDGKMKTDMPEPNVVFAALETTTGYGSVLWAKLDRDSYRIGFALPPHLQEKYPDGPTQEQAVAEAINCVKPFNLEIERLDWWTYYAIKQKVAATYQHNDFILLAGDAAHTHSSAFAQGMNTGVHDATNLIWKLAGTLKGWYKPEVLESYGVERRAAAEKLIEIDRLAAAAVSGADISGAVQAGMTVEQTLQSIMQTNLSFTTGLGISYNDSLLNRQGEASTLATGTRSPDALVRRLGPAVPIRIHSITHRENKGRWSVLVFAGCHHITRHKVSALRETIELEGCKISGWSHMLNMATIVIGSVSSAWDAFDGPAVGNLYLDLDASAHSRYGIYEELGGVVIVRPDGILAHFAKLDEVHAIEQFFDNILAR